MSREMDIGSSESETLLENYKLHRKLTRDLLLSLNQEQLSLKPFSVSGTFGKQFRHLLDIEKCYVESLLNGFLAFYRSDIDHSLETNRERLIQELDREDAKLEKFFKGIRREKVNEKYVDCTQAVQYLGDNIRASPVRILSWLTEHEILHEGELLLYVRTERMEFPKSWMIWGLK
ncbi:MAG: hypothetical protein M1605_04485 [Candidatus Thermoplasmatota archaeon]|nr:hypothetical protein [Candidatus Thermoplasmatota archaeon]